MRFTIYRPAPCCRALDQGPNYSAGWPIRAGNIKYKRRLNKLDKIERLVVFAIFMENGEGITSKAPRYISEKWRLSQANASDESIIAGLDDYNQAKFREWQRRWIKPIPLEVK